jgi:hypothetical protein
LTSTPALIVPVILEAHDGGYRCIVAGAAGDTWPTPVEAWREAQPQFGEEVDAIILGYAPSRCRPDVAWERARKRIGARRLEPTTLRLVTPADVAEVRRRAAERDADDPRPKVYMKQGELPRIVYDTLTGLAASAELYRRAGDVVEPVLTQRPWQAEGSPPALVVMPVPPTVMQLRAGVSCRFVRQTKDGEEVDVDLPPKVAAVVAAEGARSEHLPVLAGVLEAPSLRADGTVIRAQGYDPATGYYLAHEIDLPGLLEHPTQEDARLALIALQDLWAGDRDGRRGFAWKNGDRDSIVPIAMLLTALARPAIRPPKGCVPMFAFSASGKGAGKGTAVDLVFVIATGRSAPAMSWSGEPDEDDKRIGGIALDAPPLVLIDNVPESLTFAHSRLDAALTLDESAFRILGQTGNPVLPWLTVLAVTGNNLVLGGDLGRRTMICYQCPDVEDPFTIPDAERVHPNIVQMALERREFYLAHALTILCAYCLAGRPDQGIELGTFQRWARLIGGALKWAGGGNIVDYLAGFDTATEDPARAAIRPLAAELHRMTSGGVHGRSIADLLEELYPAWYSEAMRKNQPIPADMTRWNLETAAARSAIETLCPFRGPPVPDSAYRHRLAKTIGKFVGQWHDGYQIDRQLHPATGKGFDPPRWIARKRA